VLHGLVVTNPGVPQWWPAFCLTFDIAAAGFLAWLLMRSKLAARGRYCEQKSTDARARQDERLTERRAQ
jgi:hypothetical protein